MNDQKKGIDIWVVFSIALLMFCLGGICGETAEYQKSQECVNPQLIFEYKSSHRSAYIYECGEEPKLEYKTYHQPLPDESTE